MQSHIIISFITRVRNVTFLILLLIAGSCAGCGRPEREAFTQTVYGSDGSERHLTGGSERSSVNGGEETGKESGSGAQEGMSGAQTLKNMADPASAKICVFVCGAVNKEGVYFLNEGARVIDAVTAAGGYREDADRTYVNQAEYVYDAERVSIPTIDEAREFREETHKAQGGRERSAGRSEDGRININTASKAELMEIPGIGESKADRIIAYRENHGRFGSIEEITNVSGIGSAIYEGMKDYITVE